jgi:hypothetical protein
MPEEKPRFLITPETKVGEMLAHYPELEDVLIGISPAYKALKNPVLRRTVARIATLRQVAKVGNVPLSALVSQLRSAAGLQPIAVEAENDGSAAARPSWAISSAAVRSYDARADIEAGRHPMEQVMADLAQLTSGETFLLVTGFEPAPLIDLAGKKGFLAYSVREGPDLVHTYFTRS